MTLKQMYHHEKYKAQIFQCHGEMNFLGTLTKNEDVQKKHSSKDTWNNTKVQTGEGKPSV